MDKVKTWHTVNAVTHRVTWSRDQLYSMRPAHHTHCSIAQLKLKLNLGKLTQFARSVSFQIPCAFSVSCIAVALPRANGANHNVKINRMQHSPPIRS